MPWENRLKGGVELRKEDPGGTGMTIEIPQGSANNAEFPFYGFWQSNFRGVQSSLSVMGATQSDINQLLTYLLELVNGTGRIFVADRLWLIGETLENNPNLELYGQGGTALGFVQKSNDGGRSQVATRCFENIITHLFTALQTRSQAGQSAGEIEAALAEQLQILYGLQQQIHEIEGATPGQRDVNEANLQMNQMAQRANDAEANFIKTQEYLNDIKQNASEMRELSANHSTVSNQVASLENMVNNAVSRLNNARNTNANNVTELSSNAAQASTQYRTAVQRLQSISARLVKLSTIGDPDALIAELTTALEFRRRELEGARANLAIAQKNNTDVTTAYEQGQTTLASLGTNIQQTMSNVKTQENALKQAHAALQGMSDVNEQDILRIWTSELADIQSGVENLMFAALHRESSFLTRTKDLITESVDSADVADYEAYMDALEMVGDALTDDEYSLLRSVGDLAYSQNYIPGPGRLMALMDMNAHDRRKAYRSLIEEILTMGKSADEVAMSLGPFSFDFSQDQPLDELQLMVEHLTTKRPNVEYGGGS